MIKFFNKWFALVGLWCVCSAMTYASDQDFFECNSQQGRPSYGVPQIDLETYGKICENLYQAIGAMGEGQLEEAGVYFRNNTHLLGQSFEASGVTLHQADAPLHGSAGVTSPASMRKKLILTLALLQCELEEASYPKEDRRDNVSLAHCYLAQSRTFSKLGSHMDAQVAAKQAISFYEMELNADNSLLSSMGVAHRVLGCAFAGQERYDDAHAAYTKAWGFFGISNEGLGNDEVSQLLLDVYDLGMKQIDNPLGAELIKFAVSKHEALFELSHPGYLEMTRRTFPTLD